MTPHPEPENPMLTRLTPERIVARVKLLVAERERLAAEVDLLAAEIAELRKGLRVFAARDCNCDVTGPKGYKCVRCRAAELLARTPTADAPKDAPKGE